MFPFFGVTVLFTVAAIRSFGFYKVVSCLEKIIFVWKFCRISKVKEIET